MILEFLERLFPALSERHSRATVKNRLKLVLAHDRAALAPEVLESMRQEILNVVSRYVELDTEGMDISLENSDRLTILIANLPIRRVNPELYTTGTASAAKGADLPELPLDESLIGVTQPSQLSSPPVRPTSRPASPADANRPTSSKPGAANQTSPGGTGGGSEGTQRSSSQLSE